jgi:hypothetical protein
LYFVHVAFSICSGLFTFSKKVVRSNTRLITQ